MQFIIEIRGPHSEDNPSKQAELKDKIIGDWFKCDHEVFKSCRTECLKQQAYKLLEMKDLHYIQFLCHGQCFFLEFFSTIKSKEKSTDVKNVITLSTNISQQLQ